MKRMTLTLFAALIALFSVAQTDKAYPRTITVTGSAETELVPDEIDVWITLKEYERKGSGKVSIDAIRQDFLKKVRALGLPDTAVSIAAYDGYNGNPWLRKKQKTEMMASITYSVRLRSSKQMDDLVAVLDDNATQNFSIVRTGHSRMTEMRRQLKIAAIRAAREKAVYLAAALDNNIGEAVTINEPTEFAIPPYFERAAANTMMKAEMGADENLPNADFRKIKLKYDVTVVFALK